MGLPPPQPITIGLEHSVGAKKGDKTLTVWRYDFYSQFNWIMNNKISHEWKILCVMIEQIHIKNIHPP